MSEDERRIRKELLFAQAYGATPERLQEIVQSASDSSTPTPTPYVKGVKCPTCGAREDGGTFLYGDCVRCNPPHTEHGKDK